MIQDNIHIAIGRLLGGESLNDFCDWFVQAQMTDAQAMNAMPPVAASDVARSLRHVARQLWGQLPYPPQRWRARGLPKSDRNAPCHCGSGLKFKQCCAEFEHMPFPLEPETLQMLALDYADPQWLMGDKLKEVPAVALGHAAMAWNDAGEQDRTLRILSPWFADLKSLNERHEVAFDAFVDALQQNGQELERRDLIDRMAQHPNKALATAARTRLVSILADQGEMDKAWQLFQETSRFNPNDPQLWHLELSLLMTQGRQEEARLRAPLLAARARKVGMDDLAEVLVGMAEEGMGFLRDAAFDEVDDPFEESLIDLANAVPEQLDVQTLHSLYTVKRSPQGEGDARVNVAWVEPVKKMADLNRRWQRIFAVVKPEMTWFNGDVDNLIEALPEAQEFLQKHPQAWFSAEVLDDVLMTAYALCDDESPAPVLDAAQRLADHAVAVLQSLAGDAQLHWAVQAHRPLLRCLAIAVELAQMHIDEESAIQYLTLGLAMNPYDNHGWRTTLATLYMERGDYQHALNVMASYPQDMPPAEHRRALALFNLDRKPEAEVVLREAHQAHPLYFKALLPKVMDAPPSTDERGYLLGSEEAAWHFRIESRHLWVSTGALAWAQGLQLPDPKPAQAS
jgi:tetratricopeptide (TPR) repeat protein